jgi:hypothetical protein
MPPLLWAADQVESLSDLKQLVSQAFIIQADIMFTFQGGLGPFIESDGVFLIVRIVIN